ncbi:septum formation initiator [Geothermobacter hydrogeniphilus]|uniref:Septum formation initiator n=1 Tax=Geothermobacter hydrogeniphilus TaxID=1969733 RepID=A0A2K2HE61_9BACT|nr:septum formation initiator family protein [Geothermobacter hydrogeniphilus]PNU21576.1 septum formation initiator [Geothermobacter hydrogeniphilus]
MTEPFSFRRRFRFPLWWLLPLLLLAGFALLGDNGVLRLWKGYQQRQELRIKVGQLRDENRHLRREIEALKNDRRTIEDLARRKLGMVRPDELVYQFPPTGKTGTAAEK